MMKNEFEQKCGREVSMEQYNMIESLYMQSSLNQQDFIKSIKKIVNSLPKVKHEVKQYRMAILNNAGEYKTPNGCWFNSVLVEVEEANVKTGHITYRVVPNSYEQKSIAILYERPWDDSITIVGR